MNIAVAFSLSQSDIRSIYFLVAYFLNFANIRSMKINLIDSRVEAFVNSLEKMTVAKVLRTLDLLETFGSSLGLPHSKKIKKKLYELRIRGRQEVRIFYTFHRSEAILLHGFLKKSRQIPGKEVKLALQKLTILDAR